jgi:hypothetical protein
VCVPEQQLARLVSRISEQGWVGPGRNHGRRERLGGPRSTKARTTAESRRSPRWGESPEERRNSPTKGGARESKAGFVVSQRPEWVSANQPAPAEIKVAGARGIFRPPRWVWWPPDPVLRSPPHSWAALGFNDPDLESSESPESRPLSAAAAAAVARLTKSHPSRVM